MFGNDCSAYGLRDGRLLFISDVPRGLACDCVCVDCGQVLVAKKGAVRRHHFAHHKATECNGGAETILHLLAKELLAELPTITIPPYEFSKKKNTRTGVRVQHEALVAKGGIVPVDNVWVEHTEDSFRPDIIIQSDHKMLIIEVAVTNKVQRSKIRKMRHRNLPAIEICLTYEDAFRSRESFKKKLQNDISSKHWLFHPAQREAEKTFFTKLRKARALERRKILKSPSPVLVPRLKATFHISSSSSKSHHPPWYEYNQAAEEFFQQYHRYPTTDECLRLWPHLGKRQR